MMPTFILEIDKKKLLSELNSNNVLSNIDYLSVPLNLFINEKKYLPKPSEGFYSDRVMFFQSLPTVEELKDVNTFVNYSILFIDGLYNITLNSHAVEKLRVEFDFFIEGKNSIFYIGRMDFFSMIEKMWGDVEGCISKSK